MHHATTGRFVLCLIAIIALAGGVVGCSSAYYGMMETFGSHKRDILVSRVTNARDDQEQAKEQFKDALTRFREVVAVEPGNLEKTYDKLKADLDRCESRAKTVRERIASVEDVAEALFKEWEKELAQYQSAELRRASETRLRDTRRKYEQMFDAMQRAESKMEPVLVAFRDQVLYLKHNLNAQAIASLEGTVTTLERDVQQLIREMESSIAEANAFIDSMGKAQS